MANKKETSTEYQAELSQLENAIPHIEEFIENREAYIKQLEERVEMLRVENEVFRKAHNEMLLSFEEMLILQKLSREIKSGLEPAEIMDRLTETTRQVIPADECGIFKVAPGGMEETLFSAHVSSHLREAVRQYHDEGIVDWVLRENKAVIIPDTKKTTPGGAVHNFILVPLVLQGMTVGLEAIYTPQCQSDFSYQQLQLLSILSYPAAVAVENAIHRDELLKATEERRFSQDHMVQIAKLAAVGELAGGIAHEINNPLQIVLGHVQLLQFGKDIQRRSDIITEQIGRIVQITKRLVEFSRNVPGIFDVEPVSVNATIEKVMVLTAYQFKSSEIAVESNLEGSLPLVTGNSVHLQQVFLTLFMNARDAIGKNGKVTVRSYSDAANISVAVTDTGCGIDPGNMKKIFEPFFTTKGPQKGTGLGLSVSYGIIKKHHGEIIVQSEPGKGSTFIVSIPIRKSP